MIGQKIEFGPREYRAFYEFREKLFENHVELGFDYYVESFRSGYPLEVCVNASIISSNPKHGVPASANIIMFPGKMGGRLVLSAPDCFSYDELVKAVQYGTGLDDLLQLG